jgi:hypothetical protein
MACFAWVPHPLHYRFDWVERNTPSRLEIETIMEQAERQAAKMQPPLVGEYLNYDFRPRKNHPGLQCVDALAWTFYQLSLNVFRGIPCHPFATTAWADFSSTIKGEAAGPFEWITAMSITREDLKIWMDNEAITHKAKDIFLEWKQEKKKERRGGRR